MADPTTLPTAASFAAVPNKPDHTAIELRILDRWKREHTFAALREQNVEGPIFSFIDGPITANNPMGVHHAWGRTLKDLFQRWMAQRGFRQRYQNGFDCQGLWVEVEVEKSLGLNSKPEIEEYGLDRFADACRDRVAEYSEIQTQQSIRLGQWMDWDNDYYTMSDTNIEYIWRFLAECQRRGWLYQGKRAMVWCPRCGTSLSQHELIDSYKDIVHPSLFVRFPLTDPGHEHESVAVWTTTPWTLPANAGAAVQPTARYVLVAHEDGSPGGMWMAASRVAAVMGGDGSATTILRTTMGADLVGLHYRAPFAELPASDGVEHRVVAWDEVSLEEGTGIVHNAPGCGAEDYELGKREGLAVIQPVDEAGHFYEPFGFLAGMSTGDAAPVVVEELKERGLLIRAETLEHRFPTCWRCSTELIFRLVNEWFISSDEIRQPMREANATVEWKPAFYSKRMDDWLNNMGDWCISRKRYWGLPLPFYPCTACDKLVVIESADELRERAVSGLDGLRELHRPWIDDVLIACPDCGATLKRLPDVGDCWLDAGIIPFSTLGWKSPKHVPGGYATGASAGVSGADLPSNDEWEQWYPAEVVVEMREQIRLWFYSMLFMGVVLDGRAPYKRVVTHEKVHDESGKPMHKSWGNAIWFDDAVERMGADTMRWLYAAQNTAQNLNFGYGPADEVKRRFLTLWNIYGFFVSYANIDGYSPPAEAIRPANAGKFGLGLSLLDVQRLPHRLDRWLAARTHRLVRNCNDALLRWDTPAYTREVERFIDELSNWYVRRSRRRFWKAEEGVEDRQHAYDTLWGALVTFTRVLAPAMPFLAEELWENLVGSVASGETEAGLASVHLAGWPAADETAADAPILDEVDSVQRVVALGRAARSAAQRKLRQPLREVVILHRASREDGAVDKVAEDFAAHVDDVLAELSVKSVRFVAEPDGLWVEGLMPLLPKLGPKYGADIAKIRAAVKAGDVEILPDRRARVGEFILESDEYENRATARDGYTVAEDHDWVVAIKSELDPELVVEGRAREVIRALQNARKDRGLAIEDRIELHWNADEDLAAAIEAHAAVIADEVLAVVFDRTTDTSLDTQLEVDGSQLSLTLVAHRSEAAAS